MPKSERPRKARREEEHRNAVAVRQTPIEPPAQLRDFLGTLPPKERHQVVAYFEHRTTTISSQGGMPLPEVLAQYQAIWPEAIDFFKSEMQLQSQHRRSVEAEVIPGQVVIAKRGQIIAASLAVAVLAIGVYLIERGFTTAGITVFGLLGAGFVTQFLRDTFIKRKDQSTE